MRALLFLWVAFATPPASGADLCAPSTPIDDVVKALPSAHGDDVVFYYACQSLVARRRGPCDHLKALLGAADKQTNSCPGCPKRDWSPSRICLDVWRDITRTKIDGDAGTPGAKARCVEFVVDNPDDENLNFNDNEKACGIILSHTAQPEKRIPLLVPLSTVYLSSTDIAFAIRDEKHLLGNSTEQECRALPEHRRVRCLSSAAFRKAYARKDIALCGPWNLCRALMGSDPKSCKVYADRIRAAACPRK